jgi:hypothetical protein
MLSRPIKNHWFGFQNTPDNAKDICEVGEASNKIQENAVDKYVVQSRQLIDFSHRIHVFDSSKDHPFNIKSPERGKELQVLQKESTGKIGIQTKVKHKTILSLIFGHKLMGVRD